MELLKFSKGNRKLNDLARFLNVPKTHVQGFDLPAGWTCPMANLCLSKANRKTGKITDGENCKIRCYASSIESVFTNARKAHWHNFDLLKNLDKNQMVELINASLYKHVEVIRIHASGDFFSKEYFNAWVEVAKQNPEITFFGYTKVLQYVSADKPENFKLVYSYGGKLDSKVTNEPVAYVVNSKEEGINRGLLVVCEENEADDYFAILAGKTFTNVLHGTQPAKNRAQNQSRN